MITVRPAVVDDVDAVWPLARDLATSYVVDRATYARVFPGLVAEPSVLLLVATDDGAYDVLRDMAKILKLDVASMK